MRGPFRMIHLKPPLIYVKFDYDKYLVEAIKNIHHKSRKWNPYNKVWEIMGTSENMVQVIEFAQKWGGFDWTEEAIMWMKQLYNLTPRSYDYGRPRGLRKNGREPRMFVWGKPVY